MLDDEDRGRIIRCFEECWTKKGSAYYDALFYALRGVPTVAVLDGMKRYRAQQEGTYTPPIKDLARFCGGLVKDGDGPRGEKPISKDCGACQGRGHAAACLFVVSESETTAEQRFDQEVLPHKGQHWAIKASDWAKYKSPQVASFSCYCPHCENRFQKLFKFAPHEILERGPPEFLAFPTLQEAETFFRIARREIPPKLVVGSAGHAKVVERNSSKPPRNWAAETPSRDEERAYARTASRLAAGKTPDAEDVRVLRELDLEYLIPPSAKEF